MNTNEKIILISGDPNSINSEIIIKSWKKISKSLKKKIYLISNYELIKDQSKKLSNSLRICKVKSINDKNSDHSLKVLDINLKYKRVFDVPFKQAAKFTNQSLNLAHELAMQKNVLGIINCPIDKKLLKKDNIGVTEFLASKCKIKDNSDVMLI